MQNIEHEAIIAEIKPDMVIVSVRPQQACSECPASGFCSNRDNRERLLQITTPDTASYQVGEKVRLTMSVEHGFIALFYGYMLPLLLLLTTLFAVFWLTDSETRAGIYSIIILIPYYFVLFWLQKYLKKHFRFKISRLRFQEK